VSWSATRRRRKQNLEYTSTSSSYP
jgi:hypothetical protein